MGQQSYQVARLTDRQLLSTFESLVEAPSSLKLRGRAFGIQLPVVQLPAALDSEWRGFAERNSTLIEHVTCTFNGVEINYYRGGSDKKSPVLDEFLVTVNELNAPTVAAVTRVVEAIKPVTFDVASGPDALESQQRAVLESTFARLQMLQEEMVKQTLDARKMLDEQLRAKEAALQLQFDERQQAEEAKISAQDQELRLREQELLERKRALDDSDNTHARRQIRDRMLDDVKNRMLAFGVSDATIAKRGPVAVGMAMLMTVLGAILIWTGIELSSVRAQLISVSPSSTQAMINAIAASSPAKATIATTSNSSAASPEIASLQSEKLSLWIRLSVTSIGLLASILYYIRWQAAWADQHSRAEFNLQQFQLDINRANWVIESCLEWRKETDLQMPSELLESMTRGMFDSSRSVGEQVLHPADELASALVGSASKITLNTNGQQLEFDKPGKIPRTIKSQGQSTPQPTPGSAHSAG